MKVAILFSSAATLVWFMYYYVTRNYTFPVKPMELTIIEETDVVYTGAAQTHYGNPKDGCMSDEKPIRIVGIEGDVCTPPCAEGKCPLDLPAGDLAHPVCGLSTPTGDKYCVLVCNPKDTDGECGSAKCREIKGQQGLGICTYDVSDSDSDDEDPEDEMPDGSTTYDLSVDSQDGWEQEEEEGEEAFAGSFQDDEDEE